MKFGYDTIIVGGGVIGVSIAYFLTKSGQRVAVLERNTLASGSSGKCDGDVQNVDSKPGLATAFSGASMAMFPGVVRDLDCDVKYEVSGSLFVFETDAEAQAGKKLVLEKRALGIELKQLDTYEAHQLEPNLAEDIVGGIHTMSDAQVDPMLLTFALAEKARQRGAEIFPFHEVSEIVRQQGGFVVKAAEDAFRGGERRDRRGCVVALHRQAGRAGYPNKAPAGTAACERERIRRRSLSHDRVRIYHGQVRGERISAQRTGSSGEKWHCKLVEPRHGETC